MRSPIGMLMGLSFTSSSTSRSMRCAMGLNRELMPSLESKFRNSTSHEPTIAPPSSKSKTSKGTATRTSHSSFRTFTSCSISRRSWASKMTILCSARSRTNLCHLPLLSTLNSSRQRRNRRIHRLETLWLRIMLPIPLDNSASWPSPGTWADHRRAFSRRSLRSLCHRLSILI